MFDDIPPGRRPEEFLNDAELDRRRKIQKAADDEKAREQRRQRPWFRLKADCKFQAWNIDDAFRELGDHFEALWEGDDRHMDFLGEIIIEPEE
jgi:hypothetical protein